MSPEQFNKIEALTYGLLDDARHDIEDKRDIYNALRDCLLELLPQVKSNGGDGFCVETVCRLPPV